MTEKQSTETGSDFYFVNDECLNLCQSCLKVAPLNLEDGGEQVVIKKQPDTQAELDDLEEAVRICPADAIKCKKIKD